MRRFYFSILILIFLVPFYSRADNVLLEERSLGEGEEYSAILADLEANPIDLNRAKVHDLLSIPWLSKREAQAIVNFRKKHGPFTSADELFSVKGLSKELVRSLCPYVTVHPGLPLALKGRLRVRQKTRLQKEQLPHSLGIYQRISLSIASRYALGFLLEKDPGERDLADFRAGYLLLRQTAGIDQTVIGNFRPGFAQGLVFSRWSRSMINPRSPKKGDSQSVSYRSSTENGALQGIFLRKSFRSGQWALFFSQNRLDASLNEDGTVKCLLTSGYHVTASEKARKDLLSERLIGGRLLCNVRHNLKLGTSFVTSSFTPPFHNYDLERKRYAFNGSQNFVWGMDWDILWPKLNLYGEAAYSKGGGKAILLGAASQIKEIELSVLGRSYSRDFHSFHGSAFSASGKLYNETGLFLSLAYSPAEGTDLLFYVDQYRHPYRRYYEPVPTRGDKWGLAVTQKVSHQAVFFLDLRSKYSQRGKEALGRRHNRIRLDTSWNPDKRWRLRTRTEAVFLNFEHSRHQQGLSAFLDCRFKPFHTSTLCGRFTAFRTDSYDTRIYEFETNHPGVALSSFVYGEGVKWYLFAAQKIGPGNLSVKYRWQKTKEKGKKCEFSFQFDLKIK